MTDSAQACVFDPHYQERGNISSRFSTNSEADASEVVENLEDRCTSRRERVN